MIARRFIVRGRVQGVGFRYFTVRAARQCGVSGTVKNASDGSVEALAEGSTESVARFRDELARGPSSSQVILVEEYDASPTGKHSGFEVVF